MTQEDRSLKLFLVMARATQTMMRELEPSIKSHNLSPTEFAVLELLYHKGEHSIQSIGKKILMAGSSVSYVVDQLAKKQYLTRAHCEEDRRVVYAAASEAGRALMADIFPAHKQKIHEFMAVLSEEEKEEMTVLLKRVGRHAEDR